MKAEFCDLERSYGEVRLFPESIDDLWHIEHLVQPGDLVFATTLRSMEQVQDRIRPEKPEKRPVRLGIRVERVEFDQAGSRLRILGEIEHGVDTGAHHTLNVEPGYEISVIRTWSKQDMERIERAVKAALFEMVHILTIEEGEAVLFRMRQYGPEEVVCLRTGSGKGGEGNERMLFYEDVSHHLSHITGPLIIAGPGFIKDDFVKFLKGKPDVSPDSIVVAETRRIGAGAVQEVIGLGLLEKIAGDLQLQREVCLLDELLAGISKSGPVAYGSGEVVRAVEYGAVSRVLVTDTMIRDQVIKGLIERAESQNAQVVVFSTRFDPGKQLEALGGIAAILRFPIGQKNNP
ncbi:MAG: mRNA surveillance protein pelota [Methanoregulaceae archaeon]|nr:mRNA surveillance protein pelota [Methanoregulaceae archaeon]